MTKHIFYTTEQFIFLKDVYSRKFQVGSYDIVISHNLYQELLMSNHSFLQIRCNVSHLFILCSVYATRVYSTTDFIDMFYPYPIKLLIKTFVPALDKCATKVFGERF